MDSDIFALIGTGLLGALVLTGYGLNKFTETKMEMIRPRYILYETDLNNNGQPERFYKINGEMAFTMIDGRELLDLIK